MYYSFPTKKCKNKKGLADALSTLTGWPTDHPGNGKSPFVEINRFGNDITLSRITHLPDEDRNRIINEAEKIAAKYF